MTKVKKLEGELIPLSEVEAALHDAWLSAGLPGAARACTRNLVSALTGPDVLEPVLDLLSQMVEQHPSRMILIVPDEGTPEPGMAASVKVACPSPLVRPFCCEQIILHVRRDVWQHAHSGILPLLLPELPVNLWWQRPLDREDPLFVRLRDLADNLLVDSALSQVPEETIFTLSEVQEGFLWGAMDLSWARLTPWRELIAQMFDPMDRRPYLWGIDHVIVTAVSAAVGTAAALYLTGWLAGRLGWTPQNRWRTGARTRELHFSRDGKAITVTINRARMETVSPLARVRVHARSTMTAEFVIELRDEPDLARITTEVGNTHVRQTVSTHWLNRAEAFGEALRFNGHDRIFEESLGVVRRLLAP